MRGSKKQKALSTSTNKIKNFITILVLISVISFLLPINSQIAHAKDKTWNDWLLELGEILGQWGFQEHPADLYVFAEKVTGVDRRDIAGAAGKKFAGALAAPIVAVLMLIEWVCNEFVGLAAQFLEFMLRPDLYNFAREPLILQGWKVIRDICNLLFLLLLLFIAFCTILRIEKYHAKKTLLTLIIIALLINFSKPIAVFIFDGSQLMMNYFLKANDNYHTTITGLSKIAGIVYNQSHSVGSLLIGSKSNISIGVEIFFHIIFLFIFGVALMTLGIYLLIRVVAMWIIIVVSPIAFFATIIPDFKNISSGWWNALFKYSYVGPAIAFFLWLSTGLAESFFVRLASTTTQGKIISMYNFISYMIVVVFLYASIIMAQKFSIMFAGTVTGYAGKAMKGTGKWLGKGTYKAPRWAARTAGITGGIAAGIGASRFGKYLTKEGRKAAQEERETKWAERMGVKGAYDKYRLKKMAELSKKWKDEGALDDKDRLKEISQTGSPIERMTAANELAKAKWLDNAEEYTKLRDSFKGTSLEPIFTRLVKKNSPHILYEHDVAGNIRTPEAAFLEYYGSKSLKDILKETPASTLERRELDSLMERIRERWNQLDVGSQHKIAEDIPSDMFALLRRRGFILTSKEKES